MVSGPEWLVGPYCPVCADAQTAIDNDRIKQEAVDRVNHAKQVQIDRYFADSCIGERFKGKVFADYKPVNQAASQVLEACKSFAGDFAPGCGTSLIMVGSLGTGKNMLSAIIGQETMKRGYSFLHTTALKVVRRFKDSWKQSGVTEDEVLRYFVAPELLVIDEVGVQFGTATEQLYLTEVINDRYEAMKSVILLSNLTLKQIEETLGVRSMERFQENGGRVLVLNWTSYRRQP
jgi:DNA replication protein DnaC